MKNLYDYVGKETIKRMKETRYYALACFISDLRYNMSDCKEDPSHFRIRKTTFVNDNKHFEIAKSEKGFVNTDKALLEIQEELEGLALKEVT